MPQFAKAVFNFKNIAAKRSVFFCVNIIKFCLRVDETIKYVTFHYDTVQLELCDSDLSVFLVISSHGIPGYQIGCTGMREFSSLVLRNVYQVPQAACSSWELTLRKTPRSQST